MRVLITGGSGFVGAALARHLSARGDEVVVFDLAMSPSIAALTARHRNASFLAGEITEWPHVAAVVQKHKPDAIIHCAAVVGVTASLAGPMATFRVNIGGAHNVLESMRLFGVKRMVHLSTEETYGPFDADVIDETHPNRPLKPYGISKYAVERLACDYVAAYGLVCLHARLCWVYGPGLPRPRVPKTLVDAAVAGKRLHLDGGGDFRVDHTYIDDCVDGIIRILDKKDHRFDVYHVASGEAASLAEIVAMIREMVPGADLKAGPGPYRFVDGTAAVRKGALDISRARRELGYAPQYPIRKGLAAYIAATRAGIA